MQVQISKITAKTCSESNLLELTKGTLFLEARYKRKINKENKHRVIDIENYLFKTNVVRT